MKPCVSHPPEQTIAAHFPQAVGWRRSLHRCPQPAWLEFYATGLVAEMLSEWDYEVLGGPDVVAADNRMLLPEPEKLQAEYDRALAAGAKEEFLAPARGGFAGVVGVLRGDLPGPTVGFRFDIDALNVEESGEAGHRPVAEGFASRHPGCAHACGHDAHIAMGLLLARHFAENRDRIRGAVKFLFQPSEENLSGAVAMVDKGLVDDLDYLFGGHVGLNLTGLGQLALNVRNFMASSRFEVTYTGRPTHAALRPDEGKNALLGACAAVTNLYAIARHGLGASRVNVGTFEAGTTWNVIPDRAYFRMETRGVSNEINEYMVRKAREVLEGAATMYDLALEIKLAATALSAANSPDLVELGTEIANSMASVTEVVPESAFNASEDVTLMMDRVQRSGGKALFAIFGTPTHGGHHNSAFDLDERVIQNGAEFLAAMYEGVTSEPG